MVPSSGRRHFFLCSSSCVGTWTFLGWQLLTGTSLVIFPTHVYIIVMLLTCTHSRKFVYSLAWSELCSGKIFWSGNIFLRWMKQLILSTLTSHENVFVILVPLLGWGSWNHNSCLLLQVTSGTMNCTSLGTSSHSCQVTGSQVSVPAQI